MRFTPAADPVLVVTTLMLSSLLFPAPFGRMHRPRHMEALVGQPGLFFRLTAIYLVGCCFYLFRHRIAFRPMFAVIATVTMAVFFVLAPAGLSWQWCCAAAT